MFVFVGMIRLMRVLVMMVAVAMRMLVVMMRVRMPFAFQMNIEFRRRNAAPVNARQTQFVTFHAELGQFGLQKFKIQSAIQQRANEHIATRASKAV